MSSDELGNRELIPWSLSSRLPSDRHDDLFTFRCYAILRYFATDGYRFYVFATLSVALGQLHLSRSCSVTFAGACMSSFLNFHLIQIFIVLRLQPVLSGFWNLKAGATGLYVVLCDPWWMEVRTFLQPLPLAWPVESHRQCGDDCAGNCFIRAALLFCFRFIEWLL